MIKVIHFTPMHMYVETYKRSTIISHSVQCTCTCTKCTFKYTIGMQIDVQYTCIHVNVYTRIYVRDQCKTRTVLKPSDGFEAGQAAAKRARRL